jgi:hypothetical protein
MIVDSEIAVLRKVITGAPSYTRKLLDKYRKSGWTVVKAHVHPDGKITYVLEL